MSPPPLVARVPAAFFSVVVSLCGLGGAWRLAAHQGLGPAWVGDALCVVAGVVWVALLVVRGLASVLAPQVVAEESRDALRGPFLGLPGVASLLLGLGVLPHERQAGEWFVWAGLALQLLHALPFVGRLFHRRWPTSALTSAWYLPLVAGGLVGSMAVGALGHAPAARALFLFGCAAWVILAPMVWRRLGAEPLPAPLRSSVAIELAPPAVAGVAWLRLTDGTPDVLALVLFLGALLVLLLLAQRLGWALAGPFTMTRWAWGFPLAAFAQFALLWRAAQPGVWPAGLAWPLLAVATAAVAALTLATLGAAFAGRLLPPPPSPQLAPGERTR
jgi:tellurite resistance protein